MHAVLYIQFLPIPFQVTKNIYHVYVNLNCWFNVGLASTTSIQYLFFKFLSFSSAIIALICLDDERPYSSLLFCVNVVTWAVNYSLDACPHQARGNISPQTSALIIEWCVTLPLRSVTIIYPQTVTKTPPCVSLLPTQIRVDFYMLYRLRGYQGVTLVLKGLNW